jgi:multidrug efflux pump subunit AcrA (membrane-fusion protein)
MVEVVGGLAAGDQVVAAGQFKLEEGSPVETTPFTPNR